jgi:GrpB-like predicted nucleotidyltransferase (UPF0157 family)
MAELEERVRRAVQEDVALEPYNPEWPEMFRREREHLRACLPAGLVGRIEHFGATAVPGLTAKPIIDLLLEVRSLEETKRRVVPILTAQGYGYFWRPNWGDDVPPWYAWFIKREGGKADGRRTHHLHFVEPDFEHWERLLFRDYLIAHPAVAAEYGALKTRLAAEHPRDRIAYTEGKTEFVRRVTAEAKKFFKKHS